MQTFGNLKAFKFRFLKTLASQILKKDQGLKFCDIDLKDQSCTHLKSEGARIDFLQFDFCSWILPLLE